MGASTSITSACSNATTVPPAAFPNTIPVRPRGATRISLRKPYSRSQTTEMPAKSELVSTVMAMMPGYMNWMKFTPRANGPMTLVKPAPKITRKRSGIAKLDSIRERSLTKRRISR